MVTKVLLLYLTKSNLLIAKDLWQVHYQILLIILHRGSMKLNVKIAIALLEYESVKHNLINYKYLSCSKDYLNNLDKELKKIQEHI